MATIRDIENQAFDEVNAILDRLICELREAGYTIDAGIHQEANFVVELKESFNNLLRDSFPDYNPSLAETMQNFAELTDEFNDFCDTMLKVFRG